MLAATRLDLGRRQIVANKTLLQTCTAEATIKLIYLNTCIRHGDALNGVSLSGTETQTHLFVICQALCKSAQRSLQDNVPLQRLPLAAKPEATDFCKNGISINIVCFVFFLCLCPDAVQQEAPSANGTWRKPGSKSLPAQEAPREHK